MQIVSEENWHEMSNPDFLKKNKKHVTNLSSAELVPWGLKVKIKS